jgi:hypothetical protein
MAVPLLGDSTLAYQLDLGGPYGSQPFTGPFVGHVYTHIQVAARRHHLLDCHRHYWPEHRDRRAGRSHWRSRLWPMTMPHARDLVGEPTSRAGVGRP